jgi:hypothetical protein
LKLGEEDRMHRVKLKEKSFVQSCKWTLIFLLVATAITFWLQGYVFTYLCSVHPIVPTIATGLLISMLYSAYRLVDSQIRLAYYSGIVDYLEVQR